MCVRSLTNLVIAATSILSACLVVIAVVVFMSKKLCMFRIMAKRLVPTLLLVKHPIVYRNAYTVAPE